MKTTSGLLDRMYGQLHVYGRDPRRDGNAIKARCPVAGHGQGRGDRSPSLSVSLGIDGKVLVCCHGGCATEDVLSALGMTMTDLREAPENQDAHKHQFRTEAIHPYQDADGMVLGRVHRRRCDCGAKKIHWDRPDGRGGWETRSPERKPLYNLPALLDAVRNGAPVYVVEGESSVDVLTKKNVVATTNPGGSGPNKWRTLDTETLQNAKHVTVIADRDHEGYAHAARVRDALVGAGVPVRVVHTPVVGKKGTDAVDHFAAGLDLDALEDVPESLLTPEADSVAESDGDDETHLRRQAGEVLTRAASLLRDDPRADVHEALAEVAAFMETLDAAEDRMLPHLAEAPEYPLHLLPDPLGELVRQGIKAGLQPSLVGGSGLGVLGTLAGGSVVEVYPKWTEQPALWVPNIAPPGAGKSPAMEFASGLAMSLDAEARAEYVNDLNQYREGGGTGKPLDRTRIQEDVTIEMVVRWLAAGDGVGGIMPDELVNFLSSLGRYRSGGNDGGDRARWLSNWALKQWPYVRVTGGINLLVRRPVVSICGGLQPALHQLLGPEDDGFRARWLPHMASLDLSLEPTLDDASTPQWDQAVRHLYEDRNQREWTLGAADKAAAFKLWREARERWKRRAAEGAESAAVTGALSKADIQAARIALALAEAQRFADERVTEVDPRQVQQISEECMTGAIAIVDYTLDCWRTLPGRSTLTLSRREETLSSGVDQLASWLESHGGKASRRQMLLAKVAGARKAETLDALLAEYESTYPGSIRNERTGARGMLSKVVYAPRRGATGSSDTHSSTRSESVDVNTFQQRRKTDGAEEQAGQRVASPRRETVPTVNTFDGNTFVSTLSGDADPGARAGRVRL